MNKIRCPMDYPDPNCNKCPDGFGKEGLCDWPYVLGICPKINDCARISAVLDKELEFDELYVDAIRETCRNCQKILCRAS